MLAPKCPTFNGRSTFANPREETQTLEEESRLKLNKDLVKPFDYIKLNSLYEIFKPPTQHYEIQFAQANEIRKKMWRKSFVKTKPNIFKNIDFLPVSKSISKSRQAYNVMTNNINHLKEIVNQAWVKHSNDLLHLRNPTAQDMEILVKTCLMPLALKTQNDSFAFVHELKQEMHADLKYVESLEDELDELESDKAEFSNMYDMLLQECVSKDVMCSYLQSSSDLDEITELQCLYLHKVRECECLAQKLSKQTESVNKEVHNNLLKSFSKLEKHSISLELALQQCKEQMKNNSVCKENGSNVFRKEREQYHEIQDLKAQMQDKNIAISELKKLIENCKGKSVETQFNKPSVVRQPNAQRIPKPSVLGKPTPFSNSPEMRSFQTKQSVNKTNVSDGLFKQVTQQNLPQIRKQAVRNTNVIAPGPSRNCPKHVSHQSPREKVGSNDMVHNYYLEKAKKSAQLQKDKEVNGKPSMIDPARLPNTANGCKPKPRNWQASMSSRVSNKDVHLGEHRKQKPFLKFNDLQCPTCKKCLYSANHDECVLEYLSKLNPRASAQIKDAKSHNTTKRYEISHEQKKGVIIRRRSQSHSFLVGGQLFVSNLEVAFRKSTCFVRDLQGNDLLTGNRGTNLYTIYLQDTTLSTPICLMAKASLTQAWLWHRRLSHLNFDYINLLSKKDVVIGLPKLNIGNSNLHTFNQPQDSKYRWTKDHPLTQVHGNPSKPVQTRRQLTTDPEMCMLAFTVSTAKPKYIKEVMADSVMERSNAKKLISLTNSMLGTLLAQNI
ncbi:retrovirus-related pol polyprotein from transposon TNT 1-94 [Tanacetum coccineum]